MTKTERKKKQDEMFTIIRECLERGQNNQEFISTRKITPHLFYYWRKKYLNSQQENTGSFLPVSITTTRNADKGHIDFILPNGVKATIRGDITATVIRILTGM